jgi:hypothetical protein
VYWTSWLFSGRVLDQLSIKWPCTGPVVYLVAVYWTSSLFMAGTGPVVYLVAGTAPVIYLVAATGPVVYLVAMYWTSCLLSGRVLDQLSI